MNENDRDYLKLFVTDEIKIEDLEGLVNQGISVDDIVLLLNWDVHVDDIPYFVANYDIDRWRDLHWEIIEKGEEMDIDKIMDRLDAEKMLMRMFIADQSDPT